MDEQRLPARVVLAGSTSSPGLEQLLGKRMIFFFFLNHESKTIKVMIVQDDPTRTKNLYDIKETLKSERTSQNKENIFLKNQISLKEKWAIE